MKIPGMILASVAVGATVALLLPKTQDEDKRSVDVKEAHALLSTDTTVLVLDVRTPAEYTGELGHIPNSILIPLQELETRLGQLEAHRAKTILAVCRTGRRSGIAASMLVKNGYRALNVEGGMVAWNAEKFDVEK